MYSFKDSQQVSSWRRIERLWNKFLRNPQDTKFGNKFSPWINSFPSVLACGHVHMFLHVHTFLHVHMFLHVHTFLPPPHWRCFPAPPTGVNVVRIFLWQVKERRTTTYIVVYPCVALELWLLLLFLLMLSSLHSYYCRGLLLWLVTQ